MGDNVPWSTASGSLCRGVTLVVRGRLNVGYSVPWTTTSG